VLKKIVIGVAALTLMLAAVACGNSASAPAPSAATPPSVSSPAPVPKPSGPIKATLIESQVDGDSVSIPLTDVQKDWNSQFAVNTDKGKMNFMAYVLNNKVYVRADVCPPCRSIGYSLDGNTLICDRCATTFKADTGNGIQGACVDYPKALVPYEIVDGNVIMKQADLALAYENTMKPSWP
jgi:uncharacterized membrane protein